MELCRIDFKAHLLTIHNEVKQTFVEKWIKQDQIPGNIWLDAIRIDYAKSKESFIWRDGREILYDKFLGEEPNNAGDNEQCLHIYHIGIGQIWNDISCKKTWEDRDFNAICEKSC